MNRVQDRNRRQLFSYFKNKGKIKEENMGDNAENTQKGVQFFMLVLLVSQGKGRRIA
jgi:hypothetical protein